ncbi:SIS domain-containing protein [Actinomadura syzygii]|uniref:SIS domain-containing protein n=1 Tax=Actinomadura syzygii TaxID=1427538 RepID=A0A5D0TQ11_9ACTN|nr:SIS domain-containing protein [Actinomadura syzygii]TYC07362.1 SIS domain-containing protein [Actinomadura syzygii]
MARETAEEAVRAAFRRRADPGRALGADADLIAAACRDMAARFRRDGKIITFGEGGAATDAQHVAVEFLHPVVVGKPALPALALTAATADRLRLLASPEDIALGFSPDGRCANVLEALRAAREVGALTVALVGGDGGDIAGDKAVDHALIARSDDPCVVKELHVTAYHILWELVHVFIERQGSPERFAAECHEDVCVTCSDTAVPVRVREVMDGGLAIVETENGPEEISLALVDAGPGDTVLVHAKEAIAVLGEPTG